MTENVIGLILCICGSITVGTHVNKAEVPIMGFIAVLCGITLIAATAQVGPFAPGLW